MNPFIFNQQQLHGRKDLFRRGHGGALLVQRLKRLGQELKTALGVLMVGLKCCPRVGVKVVCHDLELLRLFSPGGHVRIRDDDLLELRIVRLVRPPAADHLESFGRRRPRSGSGRSHVVDGKSCSRAYGRPGGG